MLGTAVKAVWADGSFIILETVPVAPKWGLFAYQRTDLVAWSLKRAPTLLSSVRNFSIDDNVSKE